MQATYQWTVDLQENFQQTHRMAAKQGDSLTRVLVLSLYDGGVAWEVPGKTILQIVYCKPDGTGGVYDALPDNSPACTASGNTITAKLHPQMFTVPGRVACEVRMLTSGGAQLSTFSWYLEVERSPASDIQSEDYYRFSSLDSLRAALDALEKKIGILSQLKTSVRSDLVSAINEVFNREYVFSVNGRKPNQDGAVYLTAEYIAAQITALEFAGTLQEALDKLEAEASTPRPGAYTQMQKCVVNGKSVLRVYLYGLDEEERGYSLQLYRCARHRGTRANWIPVGDEGENLFGYHVLAGKYCSSLSSGDKVNYPDTPAWMPNEGYLPGSYLTYEMSTVGPGVEPLPPTKGTGSQAPVGPLLEYVQIDLEQFVLPLLKPAYLEDGTFSWECCGLYGLARNKEGRGSPLLFRFDVVKDGKVVAPCRGLLRIGISRNADSLAPTIGEDGQSATLPRTGGKTIKDLYVQVL